MFLLDTLTDITIYRIILILQTVLNILFIVLPIIIIIMASFDMFKIIMNPNDTSKSIKTAVNRIIAGLIVFLIPTIVDYSFTLFDNEERAKLTEYWTEASIEKIEQLEKQYEAELAAEKSMTQAELKAAALKNEEELRKKNEQMEQIRKENEQNNPGTTGGNVGDDVGSQGGGNYDTSGGSYGGDTVSDGTFGRVTVTNGVFNVPNQRAQSDADTPQQSGQYGLNPIFWERLSSLISDAAAQGHSVTVTSGWRSYSSQRRLWDQSSHPCSTRNQWVACPGGSRHGFGIAADLSFNGTSCDGGWDCNAAAAWVHANAAKYELKFRMEWEPWHIEPAQITGGSFGACTTPC